MKFRNKAHCHCERLQVKRSRPKQSRKLYKWLIAFTIVSCFAGGPTPIAVKHPKHMPNAPMPAFNFFTPQQSILRHKHVTLKKMAYHHKTHAKKRYHAEVYPGSLKLNVVRLARAYGWKHIIWESPDDYHWIGKVRVAARDLPDILKKILEDYPIQANFYEGNHVLVIVPRTIQA